jgi:hypothetical protein
MSLPIVTILRHDPWPADDGARGRAAAIIEELYGALEEALSWPSIRAAIEGKALEARLDAAIAKARKRSRPKMETSDDRGHD